MIKIMLVKLFVGLLASHSNHCGENGHRGAGAAGGRGRGVQVGGARGVQVGGQGVSRWEGQE